MCHRPSTKRATMRRPQWPDSHNSLSGDPGTVQLRPGMRLPATREFAKEYNISRGTVVTAFEQLQAEGYLISRVGSGTRVNVQLPNNLFGMHVGSRQVRKLPGSLTGGTYTQAARPFRANEPALSEFPVQAWARVAGRRLRRAAETDAPRDPLAVRHPACRRRARPEPLPADPRPARRPPRRHAGAAGARPARRRSSIRSESGFSTRSRPR